MKLPNFEDVLDDMCTDTNENLWGASTREICQEFYNSLKKLIAAPEVPIQERSTDA